METQAELEKEIGTLEPESKTLKPRKVKIVTIDIVDVGKDNKKNKKIVCQVEHPDYSDGTISLSSANILIDKNVKNVGLWYNLDKEEKIQKGSALALFLNYTNSTKLSDLVGKEVDTQLEGRFLCFKAY